MTPTKSRKTKNPGAPWSQSSRKARRRAEAELRAAKRATRTDVEQLDLIRERLGESRREMKRLGLS
jgi:hypothetical protein